MVEFNTVEFEGVEGDVASICVEITSDNRLLLQAFTVNIEFNLASPTADADAAGRLCIIDFTKHCDNESTYQ